MVASASSIGNPVQLDDFTAERRKLSVARFCVEVDLLKPMKQDIKVADVEGMESITLQINYENIPKSCSFCSHLGHSVDNCYMNGNAEKPHFPPPPTGAPKPTVPPKEKQVWRHKEGKKNVVGNEADVPGSSETKDDENSQKAIVPYVEKVAEQIAKPTVQTVGGIYEHKNPFDLLDEEVEGDTDSIVLETSQSKVVSSPSQKKGRSGRKTSETEIED